MNCTVVSSRTDTSPSDQSSSADAVSTPANAHARSLRRPAFESRPCQCAARSCSWCWFAHSARPVLPWACGGAAWEAARLGTTLTPMGAERAGNADGSIPAWTGGITATALAAGPRRDPFVTERPLFSITASNLPHYAARLPEGAKALFAKYPHYRMDVYPTHRTAAAPRAVYDAILRNAVAARPAPEGITDRHRGRRRRHPVSDPAGRCRSGSGTTNSRSGARRAKRVLPPMWCSARRSPPELTDDRREVVDFPYYYPSAAMLRCRGLLPRTVGDDRWSARARGRELCRVAAPERRARQIRRVGIPAGAAPGAARAVAVLRHARPGRVGAGEFRRLLHLQRRT